MSGYIYALNVSPPGKESLNRSGAGSKAGLDALTKRVICCPLLRNVPRFLGHPAPGTGTISTALSRLPLDAFMWTFHRPSHIKIFGRN